MGADDDLIEMWEESVGGWVEDLAREGQEAAVLVPLCRYPAAARRIVAHVEDWDNHMQRKIAAMVVGFLASEAPADKLDAMFEAESRRDGAAEEEIDRLLSQSVVEDIVFAATRWCRSVDRKEAGLAVLAKVVQRTVDGEYWNTASYAMMGLARHSARGARELLERFGAFAVGKPPIHPCNPTLQQEREFAAQIRMGRCDGIENHLADSELQAASVEWEREEAAVLREFLEVAERVGG
jgi:hypothetical protein